MKKLLFISLCSIGFVQLAMCQHNTDTAYDGSFLTEPVTKFIFGNFDQSSQLATWKSGSNKLKRQFNLSQSLDSLTILSKIIGIDTVDIQGKNSIIVLTENKPPDFDCQACAPLLGIYLFVARSPNVWAMTYRLFFAKIGSWGVAPDFESFTDSSGNFCILFTTGVTLQGITIENYELYSFASNEFKQVFYMKSVSGDNSGDCDSSKNSCWSYHSDFTFDRKETNKRNDILISTTGTNGLIGGHIVNAASFARYRFNGHTYVKD